MQRLGSKVLQDVLEAQLPREFLWTRVTLCKLQHPS